MKSHNPILILGIVMTSVAIGVAALTLTSLCGTAYEQQEHTARRGARNLNAGNVVD
jgi:hypothetical protein